MTVENASKTNMPEPVKDILDGVTDAIKDSPLVKELLGRRRGDGETRRTSRDGIGA